MGASSPVGIEGGAGGLVGPPTRLEGGENLMAVLGQREGGLGTPRVGQQGGHGPQQVRSVSEVKLNDSTSINVNGAASRQRGVEDLLTRERNIYMGARKKCVAMFISSATKNSHAFFTLVKTPAAPTTCLQRVRQSGCNSP